ncbi:hypothetical protein GCM10022223_41580 [Kineosporia mesophila]|uniref:GH26 domain-containing protein n=1 Tax=Kineosporia mesophila TaxID=566012 RepID=A0ABP6ZUV6_9ACTN|nr:glycosyl hydrolase [Kineosporia mesophila]MCD5348773.1 hypothetical protein [Kineosporia mesophila]
MPDRPSHPYGLAPDEELNAPSSRPEATRAEARTRRQTGSRRPVPSSASTGRPVPAVAGRPAQSRREARAQQRLTETAQNQRIQEDLHNRDQGSGGAPAEHQAATDVWAPPGHWSGESDVRSARPEGATRGPVDTRGRSRGRGESFGPGGSFGRGASFIEDESLGQGGLLGQDELAGPGGQADRAGQGRAGRVGPVAAAAAGPAESLSQGSARGRSGPVGDTVPVGDPELEGGAARDGGARREVHALGNVSRPPSRRSRRDVEQGRRAERSRKPRLIQIAGGAVAVLAVLGGVVVAIDRIPGDKTPENAAALASTVSASTSASLDIGQTAPTATPSAKATHAKKKTAKVVKKAETKAAEKVATVTRKKAATTTSAAGTYASSSVKLGVFRGTSPSEVASFGKWLGNDVDYAMDFSSRTSWDEISDPSYMLDTWKGSGYRMIYATAMLPTQDDSATMAAGANGEYDQYFKTLAKNLVAAGQGDAILRLGWEFNLSASRWHPDTKANFINYWQHIVKAMRSVPGTDNLAFDWNPNIGGEVYDSTNYYPGNAYVDYIGIDTYDISWVEGSYPFPSSCGAACKQERREAAWESTLNGTFGLNFWSDFAKSKGKPMALPEWGLWERPDGHGGGDNAYYIQQMLDFIYDPSNNVGYQSYFEFNVGSSGTHMLETHTTAGAQFKKLLGK